MSDISRQQTISIASRQQLVQAEWKEAIEKDPKSKKRLDAIYKALLAQPTKVYLPEYGDYVAMTATPEQSEKLEIWWYQDGQPRRAIYHCMPCWYGPAKEPYSEGRAVNEIDVLGETIIFVASELFEERYKGMSFLKPQHLSSVRANTDHTQIIVQINQNFNFGQKKTFFAREILWRWLVYHPPVAGKDERMMYQHRFVPNMAVEVVKSALRLVGKAADSFEGTTKIAGTLVGAGGTAFIGAASSGVGDFLRTFQPPSKDQLKLRRLDACTEIKVEDYMTQPEPKQKQHVELAKEGMEVLPKIPTRRLSVNGKISRNGSMRPESPVFYYGRPDQEERIPCNQEESVSYDYEEPNPQPPKRKNLVNSQIVKISPKVPKVNVAPQQRLQFNKVSSKGLVFDE